MFNFLTVAMFTFSKMMGKVVGWAERRCVGLVHGPLELLLKLLSK